MIAVLAVTLGFTVFLVSYLVLQMIQGQKVAVRERVDRVFTGETDSGSTALGSGQEEGGSGRNVLRKILADVGQYLEQKASATSIELELQRAGLALRAGEFIAARILAAIVLALFGLSLGGNSLVIVVLGLLGYVAPGLYVKQRQKHRLIAFDNQIGEALVMISSSLRAGYSFSQAIEMVAREMPSPIRDEFRRALRELSLGMSMEEALLSMARRLPSEDLDLVITAVLIQRQVGGNLSEVLDNIGLTIRERVRIKGEIRTLTAQGRISGWVIALLPLGIAGFIAVVNPQYIGMLVTHPLGKIMIGLGVAGEITGAIAVRKIVEIEV